MDDLTLLKLLIQEKKYPYFTDEELQGFLTVNGGNVKLTAAKLCLMKADMEKSIKVGPITIENPEPEYWTNLSKQYMTEYQQESNTNNVSSGYYNTSMRRADEI
ncbi:hypothetical protein NBE98_09645 [Clostridium swellfunianum]|uniref:hypothetical protein n=1 Tax=Clostridium swellfunianum TaxID=1367462 RepID=UPI00202FE1CE|nr:hypothetical protein [Clostridium swellfunianum]MCM0648636.1 hypothetical protein [Clostridium swellfunianum]